MEEFLRGFKEELKAVIEAGRSSYTMVDLLEKLRLDVKMAHLLFVIKDKPIGYLLA